MGQFAENRIVFHSAEEQRNRVCARIENLRNVRSESIYPFILDKMLSIFGRIVRLSSYLRSTHFLSVNPAEIIIELALQRRKEARICLLS